MTADKELRRALEQLGVDLVQDHRGIPYEVIERVDEIAALAARSEPRELEDCLEREQNLIALIGSEPRAEGLREALQTCAEAMHDYAVGGESEEGFLHATTAWTDCPGPECVAARAALAARSEPRVTNIDHEMTAAEWRDAYLAAMEVAQRQLDAATPPAEGLAEETLAAALEWVWRRQTDLRRNPMEWPDGWAAAILRHLREGTE
jgi:hypothetical protein